MVRIWTLLLALCWIGLTHPVAAQPAMDVMLVLDNSGSMRKSDPNRLLKAVVRGFAERLGPQDRLGIVLFDHRVRRSMHLMSVGDSGFGDGLEVALVAVDYAGQRTDIPGGLEMARYELEHSRRDRVPQTVVLLTDGEVDLGSARQDEEAKRYLRETVVPDTRRQDIRVFGITLSEGADVALIQGITQATGGSYFKLRAADEIESAFASTLARLQELREASLAQTRLEEQSRLALAEAERQRIEAQVKRDEELHRQRMEREAAEQREMERRLREADQRREAEQQEMERRLREADQRREAEQQEMEKRLREADRRRAEEAQIFATWQAAIQEQSAQLFGRAVPIEWVIAGGGTGLLLLAVVVVLGRRRLIPGETPSPTPMPAARLVDVDNVTGTTDHPLRKPVVRIGRLKDQNEVVVPPRTVSSVHAAIRYERDMFVLQDLRSTNGTFLNDERLSPDDRAGRPLKHGDGVRFGIARFRFQVDALAGRNEAASRTIAVDVAGPDREADGGVTPSASGDAGAGPVGSGNPERHAKSGQGDPDEVLEFCEVHEHSRVIAICSKCGRGMCAFEFPVDTGDGGKVCAEMHEHAACRHCQAA